MPTDIFARSNELFLDTLANARFRYHAKENRLLLYVERGDGIPPSWLLNLDVEVTDESGGRRTKLEMSGGDFDASTITLSFACPDSFRPRDFSHDFVPVGEIIFKAGGHERCLPNGSSPKRFMAR